MSFSITEPSNRQKWIAGVLVIAYALITLMPLAWIIATGFKTPADAIAYPPKVIFEPSVEGYVNLFTSRSRVTPEDLAALPEPTPGGVNLTDHNPQADAVAALGGTSASAPVGGSSVSA